MNAFWLPFLISLLAGLSTVFGSFVIFVKWKSVDKFIVFCLAFSLAVMIGISVTELIPESTYAILTNYQLVKGVGLSFLIFILGSAIILFINKITRGSDSLYRIGILSMLALMIHNFPEGIITFLSSAQNIELGLKLSLAIMLHNIPEGISIAVPIYYATKSRGRAILYTFLSGLAEPIGAFLAFVFLKGMINDVSIAIILILVAGIMITLSIHDLLPKALYYKKDRWLYIGLITGIILIIVTIL